MDHDLVQAGVSDAVEVARQKKAAAGVAAEVAVQAVKEARPLVSLAGSIDGGDRVGGAVEREVHGNHATVRVWLAAEPQVRPRYAV